MAMMTRAEMEAVIARGGSVSYKGLIITRVANLPTEADLAEGDSTRSAAVVQSLDQQIAGLLAQRAQLTGSPPAAPVEDPPVEDPLADDPPRKPAKPAKKDEDGEGAGGDKKDDK